MTDDAARTAEDAEVPLEALVEGVELRLAIVDRRRRFVVLCDPRGEFLIR